MSARSSQLAAQFPGLGLARVKTDAAYQKLSRSQKLALRSKGNLSNARNPMKTYLRRRVLLDPRDRVCVLIAERMAEALVEDKGGNESITAGELALVEGASLARVLTLICLREISEKGAFVDTEQGRVASPALREIVKFVGAERQAIQALGTGRRVAPPVNLEEYLAAKGADKPAAIPAEATVEESR